MPRSLPGHLLVVALLTLFAGGLRADEMDNRYLRILSTLDQAEELELRGDREQSRTRYQAAQKSLRELKAADPSWKPAMVDYRLATIATKLRALSPRTETPVSTPTVSARGVTRSNSPAAANPSGTVKLLAAGTEPRQALRLRPRVGAEHRGRLTVQSAMAMTMAGTQIPRMDMPALKLPVSTRVDAVSETGEIRYTTSVGDVEVVASAEPMPGMAEAMRASLGQLKGSTTTLRMNNRGVITGAADSAAARPSADQASEALQDLAVLLPEEPVGVGAKWESRRLVHSQGLAMTQVSVYELVALTSDRAELKVTIRQAASNQKAASPLMPGMNMDLQKLDGAGSGRIVYDPTRLLPLSGEISSKIEMQLGMNVGGESQAMGVSVSSSTRFEAE